MTSNNINDSFFSIIRLGLRNANSCFCHLTETDWESIRNMAVQQGLYAVVLDGIEKLPENIRPPQIILLEWIGEVLQGYEYQYEQYGKVISEMAGFYNSHGLKMMVLKGYACSLNWPKPNHRPCGDIDIWLFGDNKKADALLIKEKGIEVDSSHHHHTVFYWRDFMIENHYDFVNVYDYKSSKKLEKVFKELGADDTHCVDVCGEIIFLPSPNLHALFLIRHLIAHFASTSMTLRQLLDWAFFVKKEGNNVDWEWLLDMVGKYNMKDIYNCVNAICVEELGFDSKIFHGVQFNPDLKLRVLDDIMNPIYGSEEPRLLVKRLEYKYKRWKSNAWKRALCYEESDIEAFWNGIWCHLLKPASI